MSMMKKILSVVAAVSMLATSMVAYAAAPTVKTTLMTADELVEYTDVAVAGVKVGFENFEKNIAAVQMSVMVPVDAKVEVNLGTNKKPDWQCVPIDSTNIEDAVDCSFSWDKVVLQSTTDSFYKFGFQVAGLELGAGVDPSEAYCNIFICSKEEYALPEKAFELVDVAVVYADATSNVSGLVVENYFDGAIVPPSNPEVTPDEGTIEAGETADAKTWAVAVDGGLVAAGDKLIATLTNSNFTGEDATQVVELTVNGVEGGADWAFNLKVRFKDVAQRAATTLAIAKAN